MNSRNVSRRALLGATTAYERPVLASSLGQIASTFLPFLVLLAGMYISLNFSYWLTVGLAVPTAGLVVRIFVLQHDCGHGSLFRSRAANDIVGRLCSVVTLTPYGNWRRQHAGHHAVWNNLDRRESGADFYSTCATVREFQALSPREQWQYRVIRHPLVALLLLPPLVFLALYRTPFDTPRSWRKERTSVRLTNCALAGVYVVLGLLFGFDKVAAVQLPVIVLAAIIGVWLFSVQHRFAEVQWFRQKDWDATAAALYGSSWLKLPRILQWFTGNIGYHHVHHLNPRVPNYHLEPCHLELSKMIPIPALELSRALRAFRHVLWDEEQGRLIQLSVTGPVAGRSRDN